jgi:hypothetical protein
MISEKISDRNAATNNNLSQPFVRFSQSQMEIRTTVIAITTGKTDLRPLAVKQRGFGLIPPRLPVASTGRSPFDPITASRRTSLGKAKG